MAIKVTNVAYPAQFITLPAPYQGILRSGASEIIDTTREAFLTKMGESDTCLGAFTIETVGDSPTIVEDTTLGGGGTFTTQEFDTGPISMGTADIPDLVLIDVKTNAAAITLKLPPLSSVTKEIKVKDKYRKAATYHITIEPAIGDSSAKMDGPDGPATIVFTSNGQAMTFSPDGSHWISS